MRHLVVCCDGTWQTSEQELVTNVFRLYNALAEEAPDGEQLKFYQTGVGMEGGLLGLLSGGIAGVGLSANVMDAYRWLTTTYEAGDRIELFGFSRGAYTVRSLAGMIAACGLVDSSGQDPAATRRLIQSAYDRGYRDRDKSWREGVEFRFHPDDDDDFPVWFIGVWDTVGSLGIPDNLAILNLADSPQRYAFHDVKLNARVRHGRHALAMDERRSPFVPTLWDESAKEPEKPKQIIKQVYFPGSHMDVGGGHVETGLSDGALMWMIQESTEAGLAFLEEMVQQIRPDDGDRLHDDDRTAFGFIGPFYDALVRPVVQPIAQTSPRAVPRVDPVNRTGQLHASVYGRQQRKILTRAPYRPSRVLSRDQAATVTIFAGEPWNETGLYLERGEYLFTAEGEWNDGGIWSGPEGTQGAARFNPFVERLRLVGTAFGPLQQLLRRATRNDQIDLIASRREDDLPWMFLTGVVANDDGSRAGEGWRSRHQRIAIGKETRNPVEVRKDGYFYAFANDAWDFYFNNGGSVRLTVTRTQ